MNVLLALAVVVHAEAGLEKQAAKLEVEAPRMLAAIAADLEGLPQLPRVEIRLVKHAADIGAAAPAGRGAPAWAIGTAYPEEGVVVVAARTREGDLVDMERTLAHELAHMALEKAVGPVPRWLTEGFAYLHSSDFSFGRATTLTGAVLARSLVPMWKLESAFPLREDEAALAYAESYDFVAFLAQRGRWPFHNFLVEIAHGGTVDAAARAAFGRRFADLELEWLESVRQRYLFYPFGLGGAALWAAGGLLLVLGWWRRRRQARAIMERWEEEEAREVM